MFSLLLDKITDFKLAIFGAMILFVVYYLPDGIYRYTNGWNWNAVAATVAGCALAWGGLVVPFLKPLYNYAWFVGFGVSAAVYYALESRRAPVVNVALRGSVAS